MTRLQAELRRLYQLPAESAQSSDAEPLLVPVGPDSRVRALVLELARPASWELLARVWQGVQADMDLPAPAIAVSGTDGYQLWFSLAEPTRAEQATAFLDALCARYLGGMAPERLRRYPSHAAHAPHTPVRALPPTEVTPGRWSAFVAPDLASLFADDPCLDQPPGSDNQADLLARVASIEPETFARALRRLETAETEALAAGVAAPSQDADPRQFLLAVMNDPAVDLRLRIDAAKALLPHTGPQRLE